MAKVLIKKLSSPDEMRLNTHGEVDILRFGGASVARGVFAPGWQWSRDAKPKEGTRSCAHAHALYVLSGRMHFVMDDGSGIDIAQGDCALIPPGHDAWTVGDKDCVLFDLPGVEQGAERAAIPAEPLPSGRSGPPRRIGA